MLKNELRGLNDYLKKIKLNNYENEGQIQSNGGLKKIKFLRNIIGNIFFRENNGCISNLIYSKMGKKSKKSMSK